MYEPFEEHMMYDKLSAADLWTLMKSVQNPKNFPCMWDGKPTSQWWDQKTRDYLTVPQAAAMMEQWAYDLLRENGWKCYNSTMLCGADGRKYVYPYVKDDSEVVGKGPTPLHALTEVIRQIHTQPAKEVHGDDVQINEPPKVKAKVEASGMGITIDREHTITIGNIRADVIGGETTTVTLKPHDTYVQLNVKDWDAFVEAVDVAIKEVNRGE